ncbi:MAG: hypothetical protein JXB23_02910 [Candidatus Aminicenantes bacterium]|nr:hypothetical protein [Candidatus Aminicenantes bacterium]
MNRFLNPICSKSFPVSYLYRYGQNVFYYGGVVDAVDPDYKIPHAIQFSIGLEREFLQNFSMGLNLIFKKEKDLIGWQDRRATYAQVTRVSPENGYNLSREFGIFFIILGLTVDKRAFETYKADLKAASLRFKEITHDSNVFQK